MSKLYDMVAFGSVQEALPCDDRLKKLRLLRAGMRWVLALSLLGLAFSGVMTYREYASPVALCQPLGPGVAASSVPACVYGLALYAAIVVTAALALARTRGLGDELVDTSP